MASITSTAKLSKNGFFRDSLSLFTPDKNNDLIQEANKYYKESAFKYPKYHKMDDLCKLTFLNAELLLGQISLLEKYSEEEVAMVFSNSSSSLSTDIDYYYTYHNKEDYFPSPAVFVYTLANISLGEVAIRHGLKGENAFFIQDTFNAPFIYNYIQTLFATGTKAVIIARNDFLSDTAREFLGPNKVFDPKNQFAMTLVESGKHPGSAAFSTKQLDIFFNDTSI